MAAIPASSAAKKCTLVVFQPAAAHGEGLAAAPVAPATWDSLALDRPHLFEVLLSHSGSSGRILRIRLLRTPLNDGVFPADWDGTLQLTMAEEAVVLNPRLSGSLVDIANTAMLQADAAAQPAAKRARHDGE